MGHKDHADAGFRLLQWSYFNYLLYVAACASTGVIPASFAQWEPQSALGVGILFVDAVVGALVGICGLLFVLFRNPSPWSHKARQQMDRYCAVAGSFRRKTTIPKPASWNEVGFTALSGFLYAFGIDVSFDRSVLCTSVLFGGIGSAVSKADGLWKNTGDTRCLSCG